MPGAPGAAQNTNPDPDPTCGFPLGLSGARVIYSTVEYTLTANCQMQQRLTCGVGTEGVPTITVTVNGGGNTIFVHQYSNGTNNLLFNISSNCAVVLKNVTISGGGNTSAGAITITNADIASSFTDVTFTGASYNALKIDNQRENSPSITHTLSNVLIENTTTGNYQSAKFGHATSIYMIGNVNLNINNLALRNLRGGNAAIGANETHNPSLNISLGTVSLTGCLTVDGVFPRVYYGNIVDGTGGVACTDTIGNNGSSAMVYRQAPADPACGLPLSGFIYGNQTYNLRGDCALSGTLFIPYESNVVINGNKFTIDTSAAGAEPIAAAGAFSLRNAVISGATASPLVTYLDKTMSISNAEFRDNGGPLLIQDSVISLNSVLIQDHTVSDATSASAIQVSKHAQVSIRDSVFRNNTGGVGALHAGKPSGHVLIGPDPSTTLAGCITFESNSPANIVDGDSLLTDSRTGPCPADMMFLVNPDSPAAAEPPSSYSPPAGVCDGKPDALPLGTIACVFREAGRLTVYRIDEQSRGHFVLGATQAQVNANGTGMVAASLDGFAAVYKLEGGDVLVTAGPNARGMTLNVTLDGGVNGRALGMSASKGPPAASPPDTNAGSRALQSCMVTTLHILNFRDAPAGNIQRILPYNVTLTAFERAPDWFYVDYHGARGWIHADYVRTHGSCG